MSQHLIAQPCQPASMFVQFSHVVQRRVGIEVETQTGAGSSVVDEYHQIFSRTVRQIVRDGRGAAKCDVIVERLDVYAKPRDILLMTNTSKIATQIFKAILLMT